MSTTSVVGKAVISGPSTPTDTPVMAATSSPPPAVPVTDTGLVHKARAAARSPLTSAGAGASSDGSKERKEEEEEEAVTTTTATGSHPPERNSPVGGGATPVDGSITTGGVSPPLEVRSWSPQTPPLGAVANLVVAQIPAASDPSPQKDGDEKKEGKDTEVAKSLHFPAEEKEEEEADTSTASPGDNGSIDRGSRRRGAVAGMGKQETGRKSQEEVEEEDIPEEELEQFKKQVILIRAPGGGNGLSATSSTARGLSAVTATAGGAASSSATTVQPQHVDPSTSMTLRGRHAKPSAKDVTRELPPLSSSTSALHLEKGGSRHEPPAAAAECREQEEQEKAAKTPWEVSRIFALIVRFGDFRTLCQLLRVNSAFHAMATGDHIWKPLVTETLNLQPLASAMHLQKNYYRFFLDDIITTRALQGHYTFVSAAAQQQGSAYGGSSGGTGGRTLSPPSDAGGGDIFSFAAVTLLISSATFGQMNHPIGRVQILIRYKNETMEVLQGSCRFSPYRRCYSFCTNAFSCPVRGPVFTVAVTQVHKPWPGESPQHFASHKGGVRLVMTPALLEGKSLGSQVTETDAIAVSKAANTVPAPSSPSSPRSPQKKG